ncbi:MAG: hypothetical protein WC943_00920 [Elusimicrobiota bacterium]|jgi:hypothetical protein
MLASAVAAANVLLGRWLGLGAFVKPSLAEGAAQGLGFLVRAGVLFGTAHLLWLAGRDPREVAGYILVAGILQLVGQLWLGEAPLRRRSGRETAA